jgi:hypothetical protein
MIFPPTPLLFLETLNGCQNSAVERAAAGFDAFRHIGAGADRVEGLAAATGASVRGLRARCDTPAVLRMLPETKPGAPSPAGWARCAIRNRGRWRS